MSLRGSSESKDNGLIRCYNMVPTHFASIEAMTAYLPQLQTLGINVVWINPLQLAGDFLLEKADPLTGQTQMMKRSMYAMKDPIIVDPRFSVVARDIDGDMLLTQTQMLKLEQVNPIVLIDQIKAQRESILGLEAELKIRERALGKLQNALKPSYSSRRVNVETTSQQVKDLESKIKKIQVKLEKAKRKYNQSMLQQQRCISQLDDEAINAFTQRARELGITPIFDLVFNHLAVDASFIQDNKDLFNFDDKTFPDATAFLYSKLIGSKREENLSDSERAKIISQIPVIVERFWRPYIERYVNQLGFCGARVDCVRKVPYQLRQIVYDLINQAVARKKQDVRVVILEETLFSDLTPKEFAEKSLNVGATHNTGSVYYRKRMWHGGLEDDYSNEDFFKKSVVQIGTINFTGNHDHYSCAMTVCRELAFERLKENTELYASYLASIEEKVRENGGKPLPESAIEIFKTRFMHFYIKQIIAELQDPDHFNDEVNRFGMAYRDKVVTCALAGSGGYYMLAGDEFASLAHPPIFMRANGERLYSKNHMAIFDSPFQDKAWKVIESMALQYVRGKKQNKLFSKLSKKNQGIYLSAVIEQLRNEIDTNVNKTKERFIDGLMSLFDQETIILDDNLLEEVEGASLSPQNRWEAPTSLRRFSAPEFFQEINHVISALPASKTGFWSELFKTMNDDVLIAVRINGFGYQGEVDVVISNINPDKSVTIQKQDLEKIALWFAQRGFPHLKVDDKKTVEYDKAYGCIMGSSQYHQKPANLYFTGKIELEADIPLHFVEISGHIEQFRIVVAPKRLQPDPLFLAPPSAFLPETDSSQMLLHQLAGMRLARRQNPTHQNDEAHKPAIDETILRF